MEPNIPQKDVVTAILAIAGIARKTRNYWNRRIDVVIADSEYSVEELCELLRFTDMVMQGESKEAIFAKLQLSPEMREKLINMRSLNW